MASFTSPNLIPDRVRVSRIFICALVLAQFGVWVSLITPIVLSLAIRVEDVAGVTHKAEVLGNVLAAGAVVSLVVAPFAGMMSDRTVSRFGRRRPWIIGGIVLGGVGLAFCGLAKDITTIAVGWLMCQAGFNATQASIMAILPDAVPDGQQGRVSGMLGMTMTAGPCVGVWMAQYTQQLPLSLMLAPFGLTLIFCIFLAVILQELPIKPAHQDLAMSPTHWASLASPFKDREFNLAFLNRFMIVGGGAFIMNYQFYFLTDHMAMSPLAATAVLVRSMAMVTLATVIASLLSGWLSDLVGRRKPLVIASAALSAVGLIVTANAQSADGFILGMVLGSIGSGFYWGVDLALVANVLPDRNSTAKDLGIFQIANTLPQSLAPLVAPHLLKLGHAGGGNFTLLFGTAALCSGMSALAMLPLRRVK